MKKMILTFLIFILCIIPIGCGVNETNNTDKSIEITDSLGNTQYLPQNPKIVCGFASFAEAWLLSGGELIGVTEDAISEHNLDLDENINIIGSVKHINTESLISLNPDYVILSADLSAHLSLAESLDAMNIPYGYFREDTFEDYKFLMKEFCSANNRMDLYKSNVEVAEKKINDIKSKIPKSNCSVLLLRAFSTGVKAKTDDNTAGKILKEFGLNNIAENKSSILENLDIEYIVSADPDYIFVLTMGDEDGALKYLEENIQNNPAWNELSAVKNNRFYVLPKELFHYKPNNRWGESYEYIAKLVWAETF